mmetsp:Transcript_34933/g.80931  ORF Transcript_34933/g.80931 Transcript_34933/m.80931 type:complete len:126 (-) Transcript_34933:1153-1530(-)
MKFVTLLVSLAMLLSPAVSYAPTGLNRRAALLSLGKGSMGAAILGASASVANAGALMDLQNSGELMTIEQKEEARNAAERKTPQTRMEKNKAAKAEAAKQAAIEAAKAGKSAGFNPRASKAPAQF